MNARPSIPSNHTQVPFRVRRCSRTVRLSLTLVLVLISLITTSVRTAAAVNTIQFNLAVNSAFLACMSPGTPTAAVTVNRGTLNDTLTIVLNNFKPNLDFDLFTVQRSNRLANGTADPAFTNFGLAWYQSDIHTDSSGHASVTIQTILLDQIFGFDPAVSLAATNTFHVGFWFNNPTDAQPCGFSGSTPFNRTQNAGPLAMISLPVATTKLGPLATMPDSQPARHLSGTAVGNPNVLPMHHTNGSSNGVPNVQPPRHP